MKLLSVNEWKIINEQSGKRSFRLKVINDNK